MNDTVKCFLDRNAVPYEELTEGLSDFRATDTNIVFKYAADLSEMSKEDLDSFKTNDIIIITGRENSKYFGKANSSESNGLKYKKKCPYPLIGVDIDLFTKKPAFPYRDDRPHCFYKVKVDGQKSALEGFYDESIRWKMIINRINYSGGFIDNNWILQAMNISRTTKAPSWFSKQLATKLIREYCSSNVIYDLAAGWGARHDAAVEQHRIYIGCDYNEELVQWHTEKGRNIKYADGNEFKIDGECSILICPPYSDPVTGRCFEDYNFEGFDSTAKALSQCDWLEIAMRNAPGFIDATMVCKVVDPGWEQFIVDTKSNKSHFGTNNEYIIHLTHAQYDKFNEERHVQTEEVSKGE